jgi:hypothetical protein
MRLGQLERLLEQLSTEGLVPGIAPGISPPVDFRKLVFYQLPEVRIVIESM